MVECRSSLKTNNVGTIETKPNTADENISDIEDLELSQNVLNAKES